jgi:hypothetical protein
MIGTRIAPTVVVGILLGLGFGRVPSLLAEDPKAQPGTAPAAEETKVVGILTHFEYNWTKANGPKPDTRLSLKAEGESESVDYLLAMPNEAVDPKLEAALKKVFPSNTVSLQWKMSKEKRLVTKIAVLTPTKGQGVKTGTVTARDAGWVDLKGENRGDITFRYVVPWDAKAKAPKPALSTAVQDLNVGDRAALTWNADAERVWVNQVKLVSRAKAK